MNDTTGQNNENTSTGQNEITSTGQQDAVRNVIYGSPYSAPRPSVPVVRTMPEKRDRIFFGFLYLLSFVFFDFAVAYDMGSGLSLYFIMLFVMAAVYLRGKRAGAFDVLCFSLGILLAGTFSLTGDATVSVLSFICTELLFVLFAGGLSGTLYRKTDTLAVTADVMRIFFSYPVEEVGVLFRRDTKATDGKKTLTLLFRLAIGALFAVPVLVVVIPLLSSADAAFESMLNSFPEEGKLVLWHLIAAFLMLPLSCGLFFSLRHPKERKPRDDGFAEGKIDPAATAGFLGLLSACYLLYLFSQLGYFFSAFSGEIPASYTTNAGYARRGFFEMCIICAINLVALFVALSTMKRKGALRGISRGLAVFISVFSILLTATALSKMILYVQNYNLTRLRLLTSVFMLLLAFCFVLMLIRVFRPRFAYFRPLVCAVSAVLILLSAVGVDRVVAKYNVDVYLAKASASGYEEADIDVLHLGKLGDGALPEVFRLWQEAPDAAVKNRAADILRRTWHRDFDADTGEYRGNTDIRGWTLEGSRDYTVLCDFASKDPELVSLLEKTK